MSAVTAFSQDFFSPCNPSDSIPHMGDTVYYSIDLTSKNNINNVQLSFLLNGDYNASFESLIILLDTISTDCEPGSLLNLGSIGNENNDIQCKLILEKLIVKQEDLQYFENRTKILLGIVATPDVGLGVCGEESLQVALEIDKCNTTNPITFGSPNSIECISDYFSPPGGEIVTYESSATGYILTTSQGCIFDTLVDLSYVVLQNNVLNVLDFNDSYKVCLLDSLDFNTTKSSIHNWFDQESSTSPIHKGDNFSIKNINQSRNVFVKIDTFLEFNSFTINSFDATNIASVDHAATSGDDRGGMAITGTHVYITGDDSTSRFDLNLQNGIALERRDGLVSDLSTNKIYTLYNATTNLPFTRIGGGTINSLRQLDEDLNFLSTTILLSRPIIVPGEGYLLCNGNGVFSISDFNNRVTYLINISNSAYSIGEVITVPFIGFNSFLPNKKFSENWAAWGLLETTSNGINVVYSGANINLILRQNILTGEVDTVSTFTNLGEVASMIYSFAQNRWYFHNESTNQFANGGENLIYADANALGGLPVQTSLISLCGRGVINIEVDNVDLTDQITCDSELELFVPLEYDTFFWNNEDLMRNTFRVTESGSVNFMGRHSGGCVHNKTIQVELVSLEVGLFIPLARVFEDDSVFTLTGGTPEGGVYSGPGVVDGDFDPSVAGVGIHEITYTVTESDTCIGSTSQSLQVREPFAASIYEIDNLLSLSVYPNPAKDLLNVNITNLGNAKDAKVELFSAVGMKVYEGNTINLSANATSTTIDLGVFNKGMYILTVTSNGLTKNIKVLKE
ncbi:MAG: hypothetical protein ACJAZ3_001382 [Sphingobacteriales bacterium]|jgi:hypothetical protein